MTLDLINRFCLYFFRKENAFVFVSKQQPPSGCGNVIGEQDHSVNISVTLRIN